jgi:hypothetical protein
MENALQLKTRKATGVLGRLIRQWAVDLETRPPLRLEGDCRWIIAIDDFRRILADNDLIEGKSSNDTGDYAIREGIDEIELIGRRPNRFSILLPEGEAIRSLLETENAAQLSMAALYSEVDPARPELDLSKLRPSERDDRPATYKVTMQGDEKFEKFLDPYMAAYVCSQCL